jgi:hypothetical protein
MSVKVFIPNFVLKFYDTRNVDAAASDNSSDDDEDELAVSAVEDNTESLNKPAARGRKRTDAPPAKAKQEGAGNISATNSH